MADGAITVDELAIRVAANADTAAASIDLLTASLTRLTGILAPAMTQLSALATTMGRIGGKGATAVGAAAAAMPVPTVASAKLPTNFGVATPTAWKPTQAASIAAGLAQTAAPLQQTSGLLSRIKERVNAVTSSFTRMGKTGSAATSGLTGSFIQLRSWVFFALFGIGLLVKGFQAFVGQASASVEVANLFGVAFGNMTDQALRWVQTASGNLGLDPAQMMKTSATFMDMGRSMGIVTDQAFLMSQGLTQLSYDYASLRDQPFDVVAQKFQSAFAGQTRAIRAYGLDVTQAALQEEIYREGLSYKISELNRASKSIILYNALMRNSTRAQGDLARTLSSPANMMRVFHDTVLIAARAIGYLFLPMLKAVMPWLIALAQAALTAATMIGGFFGIKMPSWENLVASVGGVSVGAADAEDSMAGVADSAGKAADAAKKLRDYTLGIDELNILAPETDTGGGGGGGAGGAGGGGVAPGITPFKPYDFGTTNLLEKIVAPIKKMMAQAAVALKPFIDAVGRVWDALKPFIKNVWQGFTEFWRDVLIPLGVWTMNNVGVWVLDRVHQILKWFNDHPGAAKAVGAALAAFTAIKGLEIFIGILEKVWGFISGLFGLKTIGLILAFVGTFNNAIGAITAAFLAGGIGEGFAAIGTYIGATIPVVVAGLAFIGAEIYFWWKYGKDITFAVWGAIGAFLKATWETIVSVNTAVWSGILSFLKATWGAMVAISTTVWSGIASAVLWYWNLVRTTTEAVWGGLSSVVSNGLNAVRSVVSSMTGRIVSAVSSAWGGLSTGLESAWATVKSIFRSGANALIDIINNGPIKMINGVIDSVNRLPGAAILGKVGRVSTIPHLAAGGLPTSGSLFIAGEAGPEIAGQFQGNPNTVMPLENSGFVEAMGAAVFRAVASAMDSADLGGSGDIYMDGQKVGSVIRDSERRSGVGKSLVTRVVGA